MSRNRRHLIPPVYGLLVLAGFLISATVGIIVVIAGGTLSGLLWSALSGGRGRGGAAGPSAPVRAGDRAARTAERAARRGDRR